MSAPDLSAMQAAQIICSSYDELLAKFNEITSCAKEYFEKQLYKELFSRQRERYKLYGNYVKDCLARVEKILGKDIEDIEKWKSIKKDYSELIKDRPYKLNSETFFNSITRKIFYDRAFNPDIEYFDYNDYRPVAKIKDGEVFETLESKHFSPVAVKQILKFFKFEVPFEDIDRDAKNVFDEMAPNIIFQKSNLFLDRIEVLKPVFYRNRGAFLVGRLVYGKWTMPFVIPLLNEEKGIFVDSVIYNPSDISIIFSFTRASFFLHTKYPAQVIDYLKMLLPHKAIGELYDSIGYYRHGKTILYRDLMNYALNHDDKFITAPGIKGMVMCVFTLKHYNFVFKLIKDRFDNPKTITREQVVKKYEEVELSDRVGRMAYAHLFENLEFPRRLFSFELIQELQANCKETVKFKGDMVHITHAYIERRMTPLNIYLHEANPIDACKAILDYGFCIKELAAANIFPGDLLQKNFGVTRHGRVIFYDYDEICKVTECNFRRLPQARDDDDDFHSPLEISANPDDVFPEEFKAFMAPDGPIGEIFLAEHNELFDPKFWRGIQKRIEAGEYLSFYAYDQYKRFKVKHS